MSEHSRHHHDGLAVLSAQQMPMIGLLDHPFAPIDQTRDDGAIALLTRRVAARRSARAAGRSLDNHPEPATDAALVALARTGDRDAFDQIVTRHERALYGVALRIMRQQAAAEDATQDALLKAWTAIGSFSGENVLPWLVRIVTNRCFDVIRSRNRRWVGSLDRDELCETTSWRTHVPRCEGPADFVDRSELAGRLHAALDALNADQRAVVVLADVHGHSYDEIATLLGLAVGTVKSRLSRGRSHLRVTLVGPAGSGSSAPPSETSDRAGNGSGPVIV